MQTNWQTNLRHQDWGSKRGHHTPMIQPTDWILSLSSFCYNMMQYYCKSSVEIPTTGFWQRIFNILCEDIHSQLRGFRAVGANYHQCSIFTIQSKVTGVICRVVTAKNKEISKPLYKTKCTRTGVICRLVTSKDKKRNPRPLTKTYEERKLNVIRRSKYRESSNKRPPFFKCLPLINAPYKSKIINKRLPLLNAPF